MTIIIPHLIKDYEHLPSSGYYLGVTDFLINIMLKWIKDCPCRQVRLVTLEEIHRAFSTSIELFDDDQKAYKPAQRIDFLKRKRKINEKFKKLQIEHIKMLIKELEIVSPIPKWVNNEWEIENPTIDSRWDYEREIKISTRLLSDKD